MNDNRLAEAFVNPPSIPFHMGEYTVKEANLYRVINIKNSTPLRYDRMEKTITYYFKPYAMPYNDFADIITYMYDKGFLPCKISPLYYVENEIANAVKKDGAIKIFNVDSLHRPNPQAYIVFIHISKPTITIPDLSFDDMGGLL